MAACSASPLAGGNVGNRSGGATTALSPLAPLLPRWVKGLWRTDLEPERKKHLIGAAGAAAAVVVGLAAYWWLRAPHADAEAKGKQRSSASPGTSPGRVRHSSTGKGRPAEGGATGLRKLSPSPEQYAAANAKVVGHEADGSKIRNKGGEAKRLRDRAAMMVKRKSAMDERSKAVASKKTADAMATIADEDARAKARVSRLTPAPTVLEPEFLTPLQEPPIEKASAARGRSRRTPPPAKQAAKDVDNASPQASSLSPEDRGHPRKDGRRRPSISEARINAEEELVELKAKREALKSKAKSPKAEEAPALDRANRKAEAARLQAEQELEAQAQADGLRARQERVARKQGEQAAMRQAEEDGKSKAATELDGVGQKAIAGSLKREGGREERAQRKADEAAKARERDTAFDERSRSKAVASKKTADAMATIADEEARAKALVSRLTPPAKKASPKKKSEASPPPDFDERQRAMEEGERRRRKEAKEAEKHRIEERLRRNKEADEKAVSPKLAASLQAKIERMSPKLSGSKWSQGSPNTSSGNGGKMSPLQNLPESSAQHAGVDHLDLGLPEAAAHPARRGYP